MNVIRAATLGMCFGVRDALAVAQNVADAADVTILGELVHNGQVVSDLKQRGFCIMGEKEIDALPQTTCAMITAHGLSGVRRARLLEAGKRLIDTTCPLVMYVHNTALELERSGKHVVLIGKRGHAEVRGIIEDLCQGEVVESPAEVRDFGRERIGVVCQTTTRPDHAVAVLREIRRLNPNSQIDYRETICAATRRRIQSVVELLGRVQGLVVVGGVNSNNTRGLSVLACERGVPVWQVECAADLRPEWFSRISVIGLTAGASTLDSTIDEVHQALLVMGRDASSEPMAEAV